VVKGSVGPINHDGSTFLPAAMNMTTTAKSLAKHPVPRSTPLNGNGLVFLDAQQIALIDRALAAVGDFGEIRLVKVKGKIRFIQKLDSEELADRSVSR
jgi:hypothetical protein